MKKIYFLLFILISLMYSNANGQSITLLGDTVYLSIDSISFVYGSLRDQLIHSYAVAID